MKNLFLGMVWLTKEELEQVLTSKKLRKYYQLNEPPENWQEDLDSLNEWIYQEKIRVC